MAFLLVRAKPRRGELGRPGCAKGESGSARPIKSSISDSDFTPKWQNGVPGYGEQLSLAPRQYFSRV